MTQINKTVSIIKYIVDERRHSNGLDLILQIFLGGIPAVEIKFVRFELLIRIELFFKLEFQ